MSVCTLVCCWQAFYDCPVLLAANRDEAYDRPATGPSIINTSPEILAPRDERAGGTWIATNRAGLSVALTNRWIDERPAETQSRGHLVRSIAETNSVPTAIERFQDLLATSSYEPFYLLLADEDRATVIQHGTTTRSWDLEPGVTVITNVGFSGRWDEPTDRQRPARQQRENAPLIEARLSPMVIENWQDWRTKAMAVLRDHDLGICVHGDGFGTRSATIIAWPDRCRMWYADGAPCKAEFRDVSPSDWVRR